MTEVTELAFFRLYPGVVIKWPMTIDYPVFETYINPLEDWVGFALALKLGAISSKCKHTGS